MTASTTRRNSNCSTSPTIRWKTPSRIGCCSSSVRLSPACRGVSPRRAKPQEVLTVSDFARYPPSNDESVAFAGHAIEKDGKVIGVFAVQIPTEPLNDLMRFTAGMGATGETYLVGPDGLMRSQSRFSETPTLLETKVDNDAAQDGKSGKSGARIVADYRGIPVLSVYAPVDFGGQPLRAAG
jgi:hypothetical protein